ncbi:hypothetical protein MLD38_032759 [Melastoma candidum]|uniref:Uncharacterized protein n=1 Tax=Melastoma candidum TaxID=119954 RepID=A0ACB9M6E5_9MYRT|nr:hypothetical protein MLD38_032759 [Melastoma candidum]
MVGGGGGDSRWISTAASIWIQASSGASYTFGIYSSTLKSSQSYSQSTLDTVSVFKDIGANAGIISGLLYSHVVRPRKTIGGDGGGGGIDGPWVVHLAGALQFFLGYFMMWASVVGVVSPPPVWLMCFYMWVAAHAQTFLNTANVVSGVHNFRRYSGTIVGIMKGFLGLSGAILIQVYYTTLKDRADSFILLLAVLPALVAISLMLLVRIFDDADTPHDKKHLNRFSAVALAIAGYLMALIILENVLTMPLWSRIVTFAMLLGMLLGPLGVAVKAIGGEENEGISETLLVRDADSEAHRDDQTSSSGSHDMNLPQAMRTWEFWLLFIAMVCGLGSGLATINNISQIGESLGYDTVEINTLVSLLSIWNFLGRFGAGFISDILLFRSGITRPFLMAVILLAMSVGHTIIASGFPGNLYIGSTLVGVCYGGLWSLMPTITSEIFGVGHMGTLFNTIAVGSPVGSYILSVKVIGYIYDQQASGDDNSCSGTKCFMLSFFILSSVAFFGFLVVIVLFFRTRSFYKLLLNRRSNQS